MSGTAELDWILQFWQNFKIIIIIFIIKYVFILLSMVAFNSQLAFEIERAKKKKNYSDHGFRMPFTSQTSKQNQVQIFC